ncbi:MAG: hypothetical protein ABIQ47_12655 [Tepidiformaceae bacterium]
MPVKQEVRRIADALPDDATWDDVMEQVYISQAIEAGLEAKKAGKTRTVQQVRTNYGLPE